MKVHKVKGHRPSVTTKFYVILLYDSIARHVSAKNKKAIYNFHKHYNILSITEDSILYI